MRKSRRLSLGMTFDGRAISEPKDAGSSLTLAAASGSKTTCVTLPTVLSLLDPVGVALCIDDVKSADVAARIGPLVGKSGREFGIVDEFGEWGKPADKGLPVSPFGDLGSDEPHGGGS